MLDLLLLQQTLTKELNLQAGMPDKGLEPTVDAEAFPFSTVLAQQIGPDSPTALLAHEPLLTETALPPAELDLEAEVDVASNDIDTPLSASLLPAPLFQPDEMPKVQWTDEVPAQSSEEMTTFISEAENSTDEKNTHFPQTEVNRGHAETSQTAENEKRLEKLTSTPVVPAALHPAQVRSDEEATCELSHQSSGQGAEPLHAQNDDTIRAPVLVQTKQQLVASETADPLAVKLSTKQTREPLESVGPVHLDEDIQGEKQQVNFERKLALRAQQLQEHTNLQTSKSMPKAVEQIATAFAMKLKDADSQAKGATGEHVEGTFNQMVPLRDPQLTQYGNPQAKSFQLSHNVYDANWQPELGQKLLMMAEGGIQKAVIQLNPQELGPLQVKLQMEKDKVQVVFNSTHPMTKEVLESAMGKLKEMFDAQGLELVDVNVNLDQRSLAREGHDSDANNHQSHHHHRYSNIEALTHDPGTTVATQQLGLVDFYA